MNKTTDPEIMNCYKCGCPIVKYHKYYKHDKNGTILCVDCYKKLPFIYRKEKKRKKK